MTVATPLSIVLAISVAVGVSAGLLAWRARGEPGALPLVGMLFGQCWWSALSIFQINAATLHAKTQWYDLTWIGVVVIPVAWVLFALEYTGRDEYVRARYVAVLSVVPVITIVLALTGDFQDLLYTHSELVEQNGRQVLERTAGPWYWVIAGYTYLLGVLGAIPLLGLVSSEATTFRGQSAALLVGIVAPWTINVLYLSGAIPLNVDPTPIGFTISGVAYLGAIKRFRLFGTNPAPNLNARRLVFERMQEGAIVVDTHDHVVDVNENMGDILQVPRRKALGRPAREVIPEYGRLPEDGSAADHVVITSDGTTRFFDVSVTTITDVHDRSIGRVLIFHDVGQHMRQQQRLEVLNRVLRHNIRTETNIIHGYAELMSDEQEELARPVMERARRIEEIAEKARRIADIFERDDEVVQAVAVDEIIEEIVATIRDEHPTVSVDLDAKAGDARVSGVLEPVFRNVVQNAVEHNTSEDPRVLIHTERDGDVVRVVVADNGPGIAESERAVLERDTETPLDHGSGLGLWLITWGTAIADGRVTFAENEPHGSIVTVEVPVLSNPSEGDVPRERVAP